MNGEIPANLLPMLTWRLFYYKQQLDYLFSEAWQTWLIGGNGTGKSLLVYNTLALQMYGLHPKQVGQPPIKVKVLVPSFDYVKDVALEKLTANQRVIFSKLTQQQEKWVEVLDKHGMLVAREEGYIELPPMIPNENITSDYSREHKGLELTNGSSIWFVTSEQGWRFQRGGECDILSCDEEGDERVWDELKRGLRNAKGGGKIFAGMTPPYEEGQGPTWTKEKVLEASYEDPNITVINACMADNPAITPEFIEEFSKGKTQKQIDVQIYGRYPTWGDLVHPDFQDTLWDPSKVTGHLLPNDAPMPENHMVDWVMAFDWHPSKPCAAVFGWIDRSGNFTIFDELDKEVARDREISELADIFKAIEGHPWSHRKFRRWQDPSAKSAYQAVQRGFNAWNAFRQVGIVTSAGKNRDPSVGISIVNEYFKGNGKDHPRIFIYERCENLRRYLKNHYWKRGEDGVGKPDPKWSDYPICVRYILQEVGQRAKRFDRWPLQSFKKQRSRHMVYDLGRYV
ncbi:MAG: hypothetical protein ACFFCW_00235 [Candidatus Hodarchaeota archaeon]